jgi:uncharacterized protein (UPF0216 family)
MSVRQLSNELQEIAIKELNEDPKRIPDDLAHIKNWLKKQPHITARTGELHYVKWANILSIYFR